MQIRRLTDYIDHRAWAERRILHLRIGTFCIIYQSLLAFNGTFNVGKSVKLNKKLNK